MLAVPASQPLVYAQSAFYLHSLSDTRLILEVIREVRHICERFQDRGLPNFPSGLVFTFYEQYLTLRTHLLTALLSTLAATLVVLTLALCNLGIALIVVSQGWGTGVGGPVRSWASQVKDKTPYARGRLRYTSGGFRSE